MRAISERVETVGVLIGEYLVDVVVRIWEPEAPRASVVCVHGFAGTSVDFAPLAETLVQSGYRIIAPDMFGRGQSTFLSDPRRYTLQTQLLALNLTKRYQLPANCFLGTSWGGLMALAHVASLNWDTYGVILNDCPIKLDETVKDFRDKLAVEAEMVFTSREEADAHVLETRSMGFLQGDMRNRFLDGRVRQVADGWRMNYDPALAETLRANNPFSVVDLLKNAPRPILMSFGTESPYSSDPLNDETAVANPNITLIKSMSDPHPPSLMKPEQILTIAGFLARCLG